MPWTAQGSKIEGYVSQEPAVASWGKQGSGNETYAPQKALSPLVYSLDGEQVFALDGSPILFGSFWINQATENIGWIDQAGG